jgi:hypothetical protein
MATDNPYETPKSEITGTPRNPRSTASGCSLAVGLGGLIGFCWMGYRAYRGWYEAVERDVKSGGPGDFLPINIPFVAIFGGLVGAVGGRIIETVLKAARSRRRQRGDGVKK